MKKILIYILRKYQKYISPDHSIWVKALNKTPYCKHIPTCSEYMIESIEKLWIFYWVPKWIWRVLRCMPWNIGWYDPVEKDIKKNSE